MTETAIRVEASLFFLPSRPPSRAEAETEIAAGELVSAGPPARSKGVR